MGRPFDPAGIIDLALFLSLLVSPLPLRMSLLETTSRAKDLDFVSFPLGVHRVLHVPKSVMQSTEKDG